MRQKGLNRRPGYSTITYSVGPEGSVCHLAADRPQEMLLDHVLGGDGEGIEPLLQLAVTPTDQREHVVALCTKAVARALRTPLRSLVCGFGGGSKEQRVAMATPGAVVSTNLARRPKHILRSHSVGPTFGAESLTTISNT